jgi:enamine deaminase RidA (YjgF/YER057c/UK114 family)
LFRGTGPPAAYGSVQARGLHPGGRGQITIFVVNYKPELRLSLGETRAAVFGTTTLPASTLVGVQALAEPGFLIEIEATAVLDEA